MALPVTPQLQIGSFQVTEFTSFSLSQSLFEHHQFSLSLPYDRVEGTKGAFLSKAHQALCGQRFTATLAPTLGAGGVGELAFQGLVTKLDLGNQGDLTGMIQVHGYGPTYLLDQAPVRRTFRQQTLLAIFQQVLRAYGNDLPPLQAAPRHTAPLVYVAQYDESDFTFLHRLAAQYGEWFYYDGKNLHLSRPSAEARPLVSDGVRAGLQLSLTLRHGAFVVSQYNPVQHQQLRATSQEQDVNWVGQHQLASFALDKSASVLAQPMHLPAGVPTPAQTDLREVAARYKSQHATSLVSASGWGEDPAMQVGGSVAVTGEGFGTEARGEESFGNYLLTAVTHLLDGNTMYSNVFEAVPQVADYPPLGPPRQAPAGQPELAEVIDVADPQRLGRVRVRYYWPVAKPTEAETDWLRVSTPYSGDGKGQLFTPEVGSQVLIGYEQNRAEQPLVLGNLFHAQNKQSAHYTTDVNHLKGLQTAGGNKFVMSDKQGNQTILISNSNNKSTAMSISFAGDGSIHIQSAGPVTVNGSVITLGAGVPGEGQTAYTGEIIMRAKTITMAAEEEVKIDSLTKTVALTAKTDLTAESEANMLLHTSTGSLTLSGGTTVDVSGPTVKINE